MFEDMTIDNFDMSLCVTLVIFPEIHAEKSKFLESSIALKAKITELPLKLFEESLNFILFWFTGAKSGG